MINVEGISDRKILLVDDEEDILNLLEAVLLKEGFKNIIKASTGVRGVELCKRENPDIVVLDIMLPDIDGFEVCRRIRDFTVAPVIFLSAKSEDIDKLLGLGYSQNYFI